MSPGIWPLNPREAAPNLAQALGSNLDQPLLGFRVLSCRLPFLSASVLPSTKWGQDQPPLQS